MPTRASLLEESIALVSLHDVSLNYYYKRNLCYFQGLKSILITSQVIAGTDTTGATMTMATYQLCKYPEKMARVKAEIKELWPDLHGPMPKAAQFEKLPYLVRETFY